MRKVRLRHLCLKEQDVTQVVVFPTHVIDGIENNQMKNAVEECRHLFNKVVVADALLANADDYTDVAKALWESLKELTGNSVLIFMGHGTEHMADSSYRVMEQALRNTQESLYISQQLREREQLKM